MGRHSVEWTSELREFVDIPLRRSLAAEAADLLREFILLGKLAPGVAVPERDLAKAFGISRTPLKEALRILENEGLIDYGVTRRPRVADPSLEEISQNLAVLGALEALAGELACENASDAEIAEAAEYEKLMRTAANDVEPMQFFRWDMAFHHSIVKAAHNAPLLETHAAYNSRLWRARFISSEMRVSRCGTFGHHESIMMAFSARNGAECGRHMRRHLEITVDNIRLAQAAREQDGKPES